MTEHGTNSVLLDHRDRDVDAEIAVLGEQLRDGRVKGQTIGLGDRVRDALMDTPRCRLPTQTSTMGGQLQSARGNSPTILSCRAFLTCT
jgi:hypothetical protein